MATPSVEYTIGGVRVQFPCKAYPSQLAMMNSILRGLNSGQHCLLESPTGSGKSLALLCSALGWQRAQLAKMQEAGNVTEEDGWKSEKKSAEMMKTGAGKGTSCKCNCHSQAKESSPVVDLTESPCREASTPNKDPSPTEFTSKSQSLSSRLSEKFRSSFNSGLDQDDDFQPDRKRIRTVETKSRKRPRVERGVIFIEEEPDMEDLMHQSWSEGSTSRAGKSSPSCCSTDLCTQCPCANTSPKESREKKKIPKIFFGTRTHKQITQITHELKRTAYSGVPMTILSSRDHTCVNPRVACHANRNERCKELLEAKDGRSCSFYHGVNRMRDQVSLQRVHGLQQAWDIEDLAALGTRLRSCAYYAARELMQGAHIIFCPYNYLLDPMIRESMEIDLDGQILVLDEAHNIEDCARESGSFTVNLNSLEQCKDDLESMIQSKVRVAHHVPLRDFCYALINWIQDSQSLMSERGYETSSKVWSGKDIIGIFHTLGITVDTFDLLKGNLAAVLEKEERAGFVNGREDVVSVPTVHSATSMVLKGLFMVLDYLYRENSRFSEDYRVALQKSYAWTSKAPPDVPDSQGFFGRSRPRQRQSVKVKAEVLALSFWCLNPAVTFSDLNGKVRSIVLTSGTLSPMASFSSELGVKFTIQLEANHVINKSQVWVGTVGAGPQGRKLCATFQHTETYAFQDEVGGLLLHVCQVMSKGVLCFLPSYKMLDKLRDRWTNTGLWDKLETRKTVITEPRGGGKGDFDELLQIFYDAIKHCQERDGALLIAVCRGKVSEGLDFTDDNARAVITIGIPFPNIKDLQVELKMKYNDQHCRTRGLLPGNRWYEIQAYRALNQALGRCIRHKNDWGALILVDDRYRNNPNKYITGLSKWVRQLVQHHDTFDHAMSSLADFSLAQQETQIPAVCSPVAAAAAVAATLGDKSHAPESIAPLAEESHGCATVVKEEHVKQKDALPAEPRLFHIFNNSPVRSLGRPFLGDKDPEETLKPPEPAAGKTGREPDACEDPAQVKVEPGPDLLLTAVKKPSAEEASEEEEDETIFYTPELFDESDNEQQPPQEQETTSPPCVEADEEETEVVQEVKQEVVQEVVQKQEVVQEQEDVQEVVQKQEVVQEVVQEVEQEVMQEAGLSRKTSGRRHRLSRCRKNEAPGNQRAGEAPPSQISYETN